MAEHTNVASRSSAREVAAAQRALKDRDRWLREQAQLSAASRAETLRLLEQLGTQEETTQRDYAGRYPLELLQNAHDACAAGGIKGAVRFEVTDTALLVANQGRSFDATRIRSLVRQGLSEKADRHRKRTIGYKGVGFSSVFEITQRPQVLCDHGLRFGFNRARARDLVASCLRRKPKTVPARSFPFELDDADWSDDRQVVEALLADFVTVVRLPFTATASARSVYRHVAAQLVPETLVFLPAVDRLSVGFGDDGFEWVSRAGRRAGLGKVVHVDGHDSRRSWLTHAGTVDIDEQEIARLGDRAWRDVGQLRVIVGLPWDRRRVDPTARPEPIHVYFPTAETTGRSCLVHADFYVDSRRSHILDSEAAAPINRAAARKAGTLLAELATSLAPKYAPEVFAALARTGAASTFGEVLNEALVDALRSAPLGRPADGGPLQPIDRLAMVTDDQGPDLDAQLIQLMSKRDDLMRVSDYAGERAASFVGELGIPSLTAEQTASRVTLANSKVAYENGLAALARWLENLSYWATDGVVEVLKNRRIVRDVDGRWCFPRNAVLSSHGVPPLPEQLRRRQLRPLKTQQARDLLAWLDVGDLDPNGALKLIQRAIATKTFGLTDSDHEALHDWLHELWKASPGVLPDKLLGGRAPVPVAVHSGERSWAPATDVYFGAAWTDNGRHLEQLYGGADLPFLRLSERFAGTDHRRLVRFYKHLGVADLPRWRAARAPHVKARSAWRALPEVQSAAQCPIDSHQTPQRERCFVWDRLDALIDESAGADAAATSLLALLNAARKPLVEDATFVCDHSAHRGKATPRSAPGYQAWRLRTTPWLPVTGDPAGHERRAPTETWSGLPRSAHLVLPRAVQDKHPQGLGFVAWESPGVEAIERALGDLADAHPDLGTAPQAVVATADRLLRKLETALGADPPARTAAPLPASDGVERAWSEKGVIADIPGLEHLRGLPILDVKVASRVRRAYDLQLMSETVTQHVHARDPGGGVALLPRERRLQMLVLLSEAAADRRELAARLGSLRERVVGGIDLEIVVDGQQTLWAQNLPFKLIEQGEDAVMYTTRLAAQNRIHMAHVLADYLGVSDAADRLALILTAPQEMAAGILEGELAEAAGLLEPVDAPDAAQPADDVTTATDSRTRTEPHKSDRAEQRSNPATERGGDARRTREASAGDADAGGRVTDLPSQPAHGQRARADNQKPQTAPPGDLEPLAVPDPRSVHFGAPRDASFPPSNGHERTGPTRSGRSRARYASSSVEGNHGVPRSDEEVERAAVDYVREYGERELGVKRVRDRQREKVGWDLEFVYPDGRVELVEVKGSGGEGPFGLTVNELNQARSNANYVLYFLARLRTGEPTLFRFDEIGERISPDNHLRPASWWVDDWQDLAPKLIEITVGS